MPNYKGNKVAIDGPTWDSYPDEGCALSRGRKCMDCLFSECVEEHNVKGIMRRWLELPLGEGEFLYCRDCDKQLHSKEPAFLWVQIFRNPYAIKKEKLIDIVQIITCKDCKA